MLTYTIKSLTTTKILRFLSLREEGMYSLIFLNAKNEEILKKFLKMKTWSRMRRARVEICRSKYT